MSRKDILLALLVPCLLGFGFVIAKPAMDSFPPILLNGLRWSLSGLLMCYFFPFPKNFIKQMFAISIIGGSVQYSLSFYGLRILDGASATLFVQAEIPFGILIAYFLLGEKAPIKNIIGLIIAFVGIIILSGNPSLEGKFIGVALILSGAFLWSFAQVLAKDVSEKIGGLALTAWLGVFSGPQCLIASYLIEGNTLNYIFNATPNAWLIVVYLAVGMNVIGYSCWYSVLSRNPVNNVMSVLLLFPVTGLLTSIFVLNETPNTYAYIGGTIIISGVSMILINKKTNKFKT
ncbi:MAG: EamA family transporter [Pelagibacteraceae bacterium]|nr:EamA family transporter [Pelagibacteraceae bacterium]MBT6353289.1 EamA family transporter [Pelagibacteraceae bacterium]